MAERDVNEISYGTWTGLSERLRSGKGVPMRAWSRLWSRLPIEQQKAVRAKAGWEHCTLLAVLRDWPDLFVDREATDG